MKLILYLIAADFQITLIGAFFISAFCKSAAIIRAIEELKNQFHNHLERPRKVTRLKMIDIEKVKSRVLTIRENVAKIKQYAGLTNEEFWGDERNLYTIKYLMIESIEAAASLCSHLVAHYGGQSPSSFPECFEILGRLGIVSNELSNKLIAMARFRNLLVHRYWEVDNRRVLKIAREDIHDLLVFLSAVGQAISDEI